MLSPCPNFALNSLPICYMKGKLPLMKLQNLGYEFQAQVRLSTKTKDLKETLQHQLHRKDISWPAEDDVGGEWKPEAERIIRLC